MWYNEIMFTFGRNTKSNLTQRDLRATASICVPGMIDGAKPQTHTKRLPLWA